MNTTTVQSPYSSPQRSRQIPGSRSPFKFNRSMNEISQLHKNYAARNQLRIQLSLRLLVGALLSIVAFSTILINYKVWADYHDLKWSPEQQSRQGHDRNTNQNRGNTLRRLEFVHITKTAGSAIEKAAAEHGIYWGACHYMKIDELGCLQPDIPYVAPNFQSYTLTSPWHTPPKILMASNLTHHPYQDTDLFTVVRNPYDRLVSEYYCPWAGYKGKDRDDPKIMNKWIRNVVEKMESLLLQLESKRKEDGSRIQGPNLNEDPYLLAQKHFINQVEYVYDGEKQMIQHVLHYENLSPEFASLMRLYNMTIHLESNRTTYQSHGKLTSTDLFHETIAIINRYAAKDFKSFGYTMR